MSRFGRSYGIGLHRSLKPPSDKEVLWYKYDEDEFYHYDFSVGEWKSYGEHYEKRIAALEEHIDGLSKDDLEAEGRKQGVELDKRKNKCAKFSENLQVLCISF